ncbi:MAG: hypothetical protein ACLR2G_09265 [Phascolarctobacterium faecium]
MKPAAVLEVDPVEGCPAVHVAEDHAAVLPSRQPIICSCLLN